METVPTQRTLSPVEAARALPCPICWKPAGQPCTPEGDHLARWTSACNDHRITPKQLGAVIAHLTVITNWVLVPAAVTA